MAQTINQMQQRIYDDSVSGYANTWTEIVTLAREFAATADLKLPATMLGPVEEEYSIVGEALIGLIHYGYFVYSVVGGGSELDLDDWRFTRVDSPATVTAPQDAPFTIPFTLQGELQVGDASGSY